MRARDVLSKNLRVLIEDAKESRPQLGAIRKVAEHSDGKLSNGTVGRIAAGSHPTDIDTLADLAEVFGLQPWQLLVENLNPKALPRLADRELLSQIKQIVDSVPSATLADSPSPADEHALQRKEQGRPVDVGPALQKAFEAGGGKNARRGAATTPKQKGRRGR